MALIKCPECGNMVSDKATECIHCGAPLKLDTTVKIKIPRFATGIMGQKASEAQIMCENKVLWNGYSGQVANVKVEHNEVNLTILIKQAYTGHPFPFFKNFSINGTVEQGKKYEIKNARVSMAFGDPTKSDWVFSEVDVIDSGL